MTCKEVLLDFLKKNPGWHKKVDLYVIAEDWSPETVGRDLRTMNEEGIIADGDYDGKYSKGLKKYAFNPTKEPKRIIKLIDGRAIETYA